MSYFESPITASWETVVREEFELREGESRASFSLAAPCLFQWEKAQTRVFEDGELVKELSQTSWTRNVRLGERSSNVLYVGCDTETRRRAKAAELHVNPNESSSSNPSPSSNARPIPSSLAVKSQDLPTRWTDYSSLDVVVVG